MDTASLGKIYSILFSFFLAVCPCLWAMNIQVGGGGGGGVSPRTIQGDDPLLGLLWQLNFFAKKASILLTETKSGIVISSVLKKEKNLQCLYF
jgi:hypothetical protein